MTRRSGEGESVERPILVLDAPVMDRRRDGGFWVLELDAPGLAGRAQPGQFLQVVPPSYEGEFFLPRPMSILSVGEGRIAFAFRVIGRGTRRLTTLEPGETLRVFGPVGRPWPVPEEERLLLLGGGVGFPPLYYLARELISAGRSPDSLVYVLGGREAEDLGHLPELRALGVDLRIATDDGSAGTRGTCIDVAREVLGSSPAGWAMLACGPTPMLAAAARLGRELDCPTTVSLETPMACGVGVCVGCMTPLACASGTGLRLAAVCAAGPVFSATELDWAAIEREHAPVVVRDRSEPSAAGEPAVDLRVDLGGIPLANPVVVASGTFGYGAEYHRVIDVARIGGVITKSVSELPRVGNPAPRIREVPGGMLNAIGLQNVGVEAFLAEKLPFFEGLETRLIANVVGHDEDEYLRVLDRIAHQPRIDGVELNLSCPNVAGGMRLASDPETIERFVRRARVHCDYPMIVKLTPNVSDPATVALAAESGGADALSLVNTLVGLAIDLRRRRPWIANGTGGYSGPAIKPVALAQTWKVAQAVRIPVLGGGGIVTAEDACEFLVAGASAVAVGTTTFVDPTAPIRIAVGIGEWLGAEGHRRVSDAVGTLRPWEA